MRLYATSEHFTVYAEDAAEYGAMVEGLEAHYRRLVASYGLADHVNRRLYLTSIHDRCKSADHMAKMPLHELTHVLLPSPSAWVREGIAHYESGMIRDVDVPSLPRTLAALRLAGSDAEMAVAYDQAGWLVEFIVEELLHGDRRGFVHFARSPGDYAAIGISGERELMDRWRSWMEARVGAGLSRP